MLLLGRPLPTDSLGGAPFGGQLQRRRLQHIVRAQLRVHPNREEEAALQPSCRSACCNRESHVYGMWSANEQRHRAGDTWAVGAGNLTQFAWPVSADQ